MERIKRLNSYQKGILILLIAMPLIFAIIYFVVTSQVGFAYQNTILIPSQENGSMIYSGKIQGQQAQFTVSEDKAVTFQYGDKSYGLYTVKEDSTAVPKNEDMAEQMIGVELYQGGTLLFRGGILEKEDGYWLYHEDGSAEYAGISVLTSGNGMLEDENGNIIDPYEPSAATILELMYEPKLTHKGEWSVWFGAVLVCVFNALAMIFADELFRFEAAIRVRNADRLEPSDWTIAGRYIDWTGLAIVALVIFIVGLR